MRIRIRNNSAPAARRDASTLIVKLASTLVGIPDGSIGLEKLDEDVIAAIEAVPAHNDTSGRSAADAHPTSAITGLDAALAAKASAAALTAHTSDTANPHATTALQVGADPAGTAAAAITSHVATSNPHAEYIRDADFGGTGPVLLLRDWHDPPSYSGRRVLFGQSSAPTVNDDSGDGYSFFSWFGDETNDELYVCTDATLGAAVWRKILRLGTASGTACEGNDGRLARLSANRALSSTPSTLATTDRILAIDTTSGNHTCTLPSVASAAGLDFWIQKTNTGSNTIALALHASDTGAKIYYRGNAPVAGASLTVTDSNLGTRPGWLLWSDGTDWYLS